MRSLLLLLSLPSSSYLKFSKSFQEFQTNTSWCPGVRKVIQIPAGKFSHRCCELDKGIPPSVCGAHPCIRCVGVHRLIKMIQRISPRGASFLHATSTYARPMDSLFKLQPVWPYKSATNVSGGFYCGCAICCCKCSTVGLVIVYLFNLFIGFLNI